MAILGFRRQDIRLTVNLLKMNLRDRYLGSLLGLIWAVMNPVLMLGTYTVVFAFILKHRAPGSDSTLSFAIWLISGLVPYLAVADALNSTAGSVIQATSLVKNIVFKSECLPIAATLTLAVPFVVGTVFLAILMIIDGECPSWHIIALPLVIFLQFALLAGMGMFLGATTVFVRDIMQILTTVTMLIIFFTPIFYRVEALPSVIQAITFYNPFHHMVHSFRNILVYHRLPEWQGLAYLGALAAGFLILGTMYFRRLKGYFEMAS